MSVEGNKTTDQSGFLYYLVDWPIETLSSIISVDPVTLSEFSFLAGGASLVFKFLFVLLDIDLPGIIDLPLNILIISAIPSTIYLWRNSHVICDSLTSVLSGVGTGAISWIIKKISFGEFDLSLFIQQKICGNNADTPAEQKNETIGTGLIDILFAPLIAVWKGIKALFSSSGDSSSAPDDQPKIATTVECRRLFSLNNQGKPDYTPVQAVVNTSTNQTISYMASPACLGTFNDPNFNNEDLVNPDDYQAYLDNINQSAANCQVPAPHEDNTDSNGTTYNEPITPKHHHDPAGRNPSKKKWCTDPKNRGEAAHDPDCHWYKKGTGDTQKEWNKKFDNHMTNSEKDTSIKNVPKGKRGMMK